MNLRLLNIFTSLLIAACIATSCLEDTEYTYEYNGDASITFFSIDDIESDFPGLTDEGKDTMYTATVTGSDYPFAIDQINGLIYNIDSLPVGTDITKVVVDSIIADGYVYIVGDEDNDSIWSSEDSLNFEKPIHFKVLAYNGNFGRTYTAQINVHQQVPDSMSWSRFNSNFSTEIEKQKAIYCNNQILVFAEQADQVGVTMTSQDDGSSWTSLQAIDIPVKADYSSVMVWGNAIYILAENELYSSTNGINWTKVITAQKLSSLVAGIDSNNDKKLIGITTDNLYTESTDGESWYTYETMPSNFPQGTYSFAAYPLSTNANLNRMVVMGQNMAENDSTNYAWTQLVSEHQWSELNTETYKNNCPNFENPTMIYYNNQLYAFGGPSQNGFSLNAFECFYTSKDNGLGWEKVTKRVMFPKEFTALYTEGGNYSCTVDNNHFIWIMWSKSGEVWRGRINKLGFVNQ